MKRMVSAARTAALLAGLGLTATTATAGVIDEGLVEVLNNTPDGEVVSTLVYLSQQVDLEAMNQDFEANRVTSYDDRHREVVVTLRDLADVTQGGLLNHLADLRLNDRIESYQAFWVVNAIRVDAVKAEIEQLAQHPDVGTIYFNYPIELITPTEMRKDEGGPLDDPEPGVQAVRAPEVWNLGFRGEGVLVANLDTGVDGGHPALDSRWRGHDPRYAGNPDWAYFDPNNICGPTPCDSGSHGTHTMGTVVGGAPGREIGVAPGAEWIAAAVIDIGGIPNTVAKAILAFQWCVDPDGNPGTSWDVPDVCSNSWGLVTSHGYPPCDQTFWQYIDASEAVGTIQLFSAGNEGSSGLRRPADRAMDEYRSTAVAAVDGNNPSWPIASFSSRGPTFCTPGGQAAIKPDIAAPGVSVVSSVPGGNYSAFSGTSMASPHVNGVMALMRQANPGLPVDEAKQIVYETAFDLGSPGEDNSYGYGMIDAFEAVNEAISRTSVQWIYPDGRPDIIDPAGGTTFRVEVVGIGAEPIPDTGLLHYKQGGGNFIAVAMDEVSQNVYDATFPAVDCLETVLYYVSVDTDQGTFTNPFNAPATTFSADSYSGIESVFVDTFETNNGWSVENLGATTGDWQRGVPVNDPGWDYDPLSDSDGSGQCWLTQNEIGNTDVDNGAVRLTSNVFSLADGYNVSYDYFLNLTNTTGGVDRMLVEVSNNGGASWVEVTRHDTSGGLSWRTHTITTDDLVNAGVPPTSNMMIRYTTNDADPQSINESGIDHFEIWRYLCDTNTAFASSFNVDFGRLTGGGLAELRESDDQRMVIEQRFAVTPTLPNIRVTLDATAPTETPQEMTFTLEASATAQPPSVPQTIELFNYDTNSWEEVDQRTATLTDSTVALNFAANPERFIEAGTRSMRARLSWFDPGAVLFANWSARIDVAKWEFVQ